MFPFTGFVFMPFIFNSIYLFEGILKETKQENSICYSCPALLPNTFLGQFSHFLHKIGGSS